MPVYEVQDPKTGRTFEIEGAQMPSAEQLTQMFAQMGGGQPPPRPGPPARPAASEDYLPDTDPRVAALTSFLQDTAVGAAKGAGHTAVGLGRLMHQIPGVSRGVDALYALTGRGVNSGEAVNLSRNGNGQGGTESVLGLDPTNTNQRVGMAAEQVAEFFVPGSKVTQAVTRLARPAVTAATRAIPATARGAQVARGAVRVAPAVVGEATTAAGVTAAQGGDTGTAATIAGAVPVVGRAVSRTAPVLREAAENQVVRALGPTKERFKAVAERIAPEMLERNVGGAVGKSREGLLETAKANTSAAAKQIDDVLQNAKGQTVKTQPIVDALETAKKEFSLSREMPMDEAIRSGIVTFDRKGRAIIAKKGAKFVGNKVELATELDARPLQQLTRLQQTIRELGEDASVEHIVAARRAWDKVVGAAGGYAHRTGGAFGVPLREQSEAWAKREATSAIRKVLAEEVPDLAKVNKEFAFWKDLQDVVTATQKRTQAQGGGVSKAITTAVGAGSGFASGGDITDRVQNAVLGGALGRAAVKAFTSPRYRLISAKVKHDLADAIASGQADRIELALGRVNAAIGSGAVSPRPAVAR